MRKLLMLFLTTCATGAAFAQFTFQGNIEYERKINVHRQMEEYDDNGWFEKIKSQVPRFTTSFFNLYFTPTQTIYKPGREGENPMKMFGGAPASENIVYTDLKTEKVTAAKQVYEQKFLVEDTLRKMEWRITDEVRTIADYKCRKAVGKICDSVYVVAFYTEDIAVSGGPEMFAGLPGMILEIAIPRLYSTWVATKVEITPPVAKDFEQPTKGKKTTQEGLYGTLSASLKDWGKYAARNIWWCML